MYRAVWIYNKKMAGPGAAPLLFMKNAGRGIILWKMCC